MASAKPTAALTLAELADVLARALGADYDGVRSGRVRDLPDARTIRWYQTLGMVDRPAAFQGRTALYTRRHLLQLAAIKKLQASGFPLADIQQGLAGKNDAELARAAGLSLKDLDRLVGAVPLARSKAETDRLTTALASRPAAPRSAEAFWQHRPADHAASGVVPKATASTLQSVALGGGVVLLWNGRPLTAAEAAAASRLSQPVVEYLSSRAASVAAEPAAGTPAPSPRPKTGARP